MCQQSLVDRGLLKYTNPSPGSSPFVHLDVSRYPFILMWYVFFLCLRLKKKRKNTNQLRGELNGKWSRSPTQIWTTCTFPRLFRVIYIPCLFIILIYAMASEARKKNTIRNKVFLCVSFWITCVSLTWFNSPNSPQAIDRFNS